MEIPQELRGDEWRDFYTEDNRTHLWFSQPHELTDRYKENFLRYCYHYLAVEGNSTTMAAERDNPFAMQVFLEVDLSNPFSMDDVLAGTQWRSVEEAYQAYCDAFGRMFGEAGQAPSSSDIPDELQTGRWSNLYSQLNRTLLANASSAQDLNGELRNHFALFCGHYANPKPDGPLVAPEHFTATNPFDPPPVLKDTPWSTLKEAFGDYRAAFERHYLESVRSAAGSHGGASSGRCIPAELQTKEWLIYYTPQNASELDQLSDPDCLTVKNPLRENFALYCISYSGIKRPGSFYMLPFADPNPFKLPRILEGTGWGSLKSAFDDYRAAFNELTLELHTRHHVDKPGGKGGDGKPGRRSTPDPETRHQEVERVRAMADYYRETLSKLELAMLGSVIVDNQYSAHLDEFNKSCEKVREAAENIFSGKRSWQQFQAIGYLLRKPGK
ncbi:hypothetical protein [Streptomyces wuyuanensis]|uniref:hypothetical protein n=1 Tax=Streptomyces wuyuanensis TaxID=1196353 RepID=UPI00341A2039